ncbi:MAG: HAMP domain-containing sensor histidine kinase [Candidatus Paceibacterota bacterium]
MEKIQRLIKILFSVLYIIVIFLLMLKNEQMILSYNLPKWIIPAVFFVSILYICYKYITFIIKEDKLEEEIISIINHTFRTPLTSILWHAKELEKNLPQNEKFLYLQNINNGANRILNIVEVLTGIKNIKNTSGYFFKAISIREIIEKSIKKYRDKINKKNIIFQVSTFADIPLLTLDLNKISFVIDTIIENAISYTKKDGKILIDCISNPQKLILFISDTGIGLDRIDKMMIFSKFYRNKKAKLMNTDGMGLRLYLSKQIIKRHHGKIYAKSNGLNEGTTFFIELPFRK